METNILDSLVEFYNNNSTAFSVLGAVASAIFASGIFSFLRRPKKVSQGGSFFNNGELLSPPMTRPAYSDRMAYVLAEMSALAYFQFEGSDGPLQKAVDDFLKLDHLGDETDHCRTEIRDLLKTFAEDLLVKSIDSREFLEEILKRADFSLIDTINIGDTQAFICKREAQNEDPYIVVAFRGTEMEIGDWLTDAQAKPVIDEETGTRIHSGFYKALNNKDNEAGKSVLEVIGKILDSSKVKKGKQKLPVFFTGHSLGGALALLTTRELADNINGACYTYGAPRVANYEYFENMKTPVFRIVNSSDIVPRVPPGAIMGVLLKVIQGISWACALVPGAGKLLKKIEHTLDMLNGYRHYGDQRYLTDVESGRFHTVKLLSNPPLIDRIAWMGQHIRASFLAPVKSHGMAIYRSKLVHIAKVRNRRGE